MKKYLIGSLALSLILTLAACKKYLNVVPDNVATIDNAFTMRSQAEKFLFTCFSYMPRDGGTDTDPAMMASDEFWSTDNVSGAYRNILKGFQSVTAPYGDNWEHYYRALRDCNIFLENINSVPDLKDFERRRWIAEVKFLKAYYHFYMVRMYGPIPLIRTNLPVNADVDQVKVYRSPVDSCFNYISQLIDEAVPGLPPTIDNPTRELGRPTQLIALALKAKVLVTAASPLFNGNSDQKGLIDNRGISLFNPAYSKTKWDSAMVACKRAVEMAESQGYKLYTYQPPIQQFKLSDTILTQLSIRNAVTEKWNSEIIWGNSMTNTSGFQQLITPFLDNRYLDQVITRGLFSPTMRLVETFYSDKGVPINEDKTWNYADRYKLRQAKDKDKKYIRNGSTTAVMNFDREPRFYADLGFDTGIWYGQGNYDDSKDLELFALAAKFREPQGPGKPDYATVTGYYLKKMVHFQNVIAQTSYSTTPYPWTVIRLSDLYLLYAEAINETVGPNDEVHRYLNLIRTRAGLKSVRDSWTNFSTNPAKFASQDGMRSIIHQERAIELAFEAQRFWDLRRWKEATTVLNGDITGWDVGQTTNAAYYVNKKIFAVTFGTKDYFWPIKESNIIVNRNLVQNIGW